MLLSELLSTGVVVSVTIILATVVPYIRGKLRTRHDKARVDAFCSRARSNRLKSQLSGAQVIALANPNGGSRRAVGTFHTVLKPMCDALKINVQLVTTTHAGHAKHITEGLPDDVALVICLSGDGMLHEALAGLVHRDQKMRLPLAILPCGSSNGVCKSLYDTVDVFEAMQRILTGERRVASLVSAQPLGSSSDAAAYDIMGLSHAGIMDVNELTEIKLRWMNKLPLGGMLKDLIAALVVIGRHKTHRVAIQFEAAALTEEEIAHWEQLGYSDPTADGNQYRPKLTPVEPPKDCMSTEAGTQWFMFEDDLVWCEAMKISWISYDCQVCPLLRAEDQHMNMVFSRGHSRWQLLTSFLKGEEGKHVHDPWMDRYKVHSVVITPAKTSSFGMSGEFIQFRDPNAVLAKCLKDHALLWY